MGSFSVAEAKDQLSRLIRLAESGQEVCLTRRGRPVAMLLGQGHYEELRAGGRGFEERYRRFREQYDLEELDIDPGEVFAGARQPSPGREFRW